MKGFHGLEEVNQLSNFLSRFYINLYNCISEGIILFRPYLNIYFLNWQPLVPVVGAEDGQWLVTKPFNPLSKPGGHGVIWKLAYDKGIFNWFYCQGRKGATVRQVRSVVMFDISSVYYFSFLVEKFVFTG